MIILELSNKYEATYRASLKEGHDYGTGQRSVTSQLCVMALEGSEPVDVRDGRRYSDSRRCMECTNNCRRHGNMVAGEWHGTRWFVAGGCRSWGLIRAGNLARPSPAQARASPARL